jgi:hypothetical protein
MPDAGRRVRIRLIGIGGSALRFNQCQGCPAGLMFGPENRAALFLRERVIRQKAAPARAFPGAIQGEGKQLSAVKLSESGLPGRDRPNK